jgi:hypothetical protein
MEPKWRFKGNGRLKDESSQYYALSSENDTTVIVLKVMLNGNGTWEIYKEERWTDGGADSTFRKERYNNTRII